jgi:hypothetical protein
MLKITVGLALQRKSHKKFFSAKNFQFLADFAVLLEKVDSHVALSDTININN